MLLSEMFGSTGGTATITGKPAPKHWRDRIPQLFPEYVKHPFSERHEDFWDHIQGIEAHSTPRPFVAVWSRGGAKSTSAEMACTDLGIRNKRRYALYLRMTQDMADKSVANVAAMLESRRVAEYFPEHAERKLSKFGSSLGWRRNRVRTAGGFTLDGIGLDTAARGVKVEEQRPDVIFIDDVDDKLDTLAVVAKKIAIITHSILPAGAENVAVIAIQNLIHADGFFTRMVDGRADYLRDRLVSGPYPAVDGLEVEERDDPETGTKRYFVVGGTPTWEGQNLAWCQREIDLIGLSAFRKECQHEVTDRSDSLALRFDESRHFADLSHGEVVSLVRMGRVFGGIDFGAWRFAFTLWAVDRGGVPHRIGELFSQRESLETRAKAIAKIVESVGITGPIMIWGDAANPTDIMELNLAFKRIGSTLRVIAVASENKLRKTSVDRINDLLDRNAFKLVRNVGSDMQWQHGMNAASAGTEMQGSRLLWEIEHWGYPVPKEGEAQEQDPDDDTADGGDAIASMRYALMSWFKPADKENTVTEGKREDRAREYDFKNKRFVRDPSFDDEVKGKSPRRYTRPIHTPRVRR